MAPPVKPAVSPTWGTAIDAGDISTPPNSQLQSGIVKVGIPPIPQKLPYQWFNWLFVYVTQWVTYVNLVLGNTSQYAGGTDQADFGITPNVYVLNITGFPTNANILDGTIVSWMVGFYENGGGNPTGNDNTGDCTIKINGQAGIHILDKYGNTLTQGNDLTYNQNVLMVYNKGLLAWILPNYSASQAPNFLGGADSGAANAYVVPVQGFPTLEGPTPSAQAIKKGTRLAFYPAHNNTGASTLIVNATVSYNIKTKAGANPASGAMIANFMADFIHDGTNWILLNPQA